MDWMSLSPILTPQEARVLYAFYHGCDTQAEIVQVFDSDKSVISNASRAAERLGYVYLDDINHVWCRTMTWPEVIEDLKKRTEAHLRLVLSAIDDLADVEPWWEADDA